MINRAPLHPLRTLLYLARAILAVYGRKGFSRFAAAISYRASFSIVPHASESVSASPATSAGDGPPPRRDGRGHYGGSRYRRAHRHVVEALEDELRDLLGGVAERVAEDEPS